MKVIILKDTKTLGKSGEIKEVNDGYAINYLIPNQLVLSATEANHKILAETMRQSTNKKTMVKQQIVALAQKVKNEKYTIIVNVADKRKIFGNITSSQVAKVINEKIEKLNLKHEQVILKEPIKSIGKHSVILKLHPDVETEITLEVKAS